MKDTIKINKNGVKMVAHRGVSGLECENTSAAFVAAGNRSYFGIETDAHITSDGKVIVFHDDDAKRLANKDIIIEQTPYEKLKKLQLTDSDGTTRTDYIIPDLTDYIGICKKYDKVAVLELKNKMPFDSVKNIIEIIDSMDYLDKTIFISFSMENMMAVRELLPEQTAQFLSDLCNDELIETLAEHKLDIDMLYENVTKEIVDKLHARGIKINCWTCNDTETADRLISYGVDYMTSNILE